MGWWRSIKRGVSSVEKHTVGKVSSGVRTVGKVASSAVSAVGTAAGAVASATGYAINKITDAERWLKANAGRVPIVGPELQVLVRKAFEMKLPLINMSFDDLRDMSIAKLKVIQNIARATKSMTDVVGGKGDIKDSLKAVMVATNAASGGKIDKAVAAKIDKAYLKILPKFKAANAKLDKMVQKGLIPERTLHSIKSKLR